MKLKVIRNCCLSLEYLFPFQESYGLEFQWNYCHRSQFCHKIQHSQWLVNPNLFCQHILNFLLDTENRNCEIKQKLWLVRVIWTEHQMTDCRFSIESKQKSYKLTVSWLLGICQSNHFQDLKQSKMLWKKPNIHYFIG